MIRRKGIKYAALAIGFGLGTDRQMIFVDQVPVIKSPVVAVDVAVALLQKWLFVARAFPWILEDGIRS